MVRTLVTVSCKLQAPLPYAMLNPLSFFIRFCKDPTLLGGGRGMNWMLWDSLSFMPKKALFHYVKIKLSTVRTILKFASAVPTYFGKGCRSFLNIN